MSSQSMTGERRQQSDVLSCYVSSQPACIYASTEVWILAVTRFAAVACTPVRSLILTHSGVCRSFLTRKSGGRKPYELLSHSGSAYTPLAAPKRMGVVLSLLAQLKSSALHAIKGYTPQGTVGRVVSMQPSRCPLKVFLLYRKPCTAHLAQSVEVLPQSNWPVDCDWRRAWLCGRASRAPGEGSV